MSNKKVVKENESKKNAGHGPGSKTWGANPGKVANKYPKGWGQKGMKSNSNSGNE